jgi:hypothetical protein
MDDMDLGGLEVLIVGNTFLKDLVENMRLNSLCLESEGFDLIKGIYQEKARIIGPKATLIPAVHLEMLRGKYDIVMLQLGDSDIDHLYSQEGLDGLIENYILEANAISMIFMVKVVICAAIPRGPTQYLFHNYYCTRFNEQMARYVKEDKEHDQVTFWTHKGLDQPEGKFLMMDHVRLNPRGQRKLYFSLRTAMRTQRERKRKH